MFIMTEVETRRIISIPVMQILRFLVLRTLIRDNYLDTQYSLFLSPLSTQIDT